MEHEEKDAAMTHSSLFAAMALLLGPVCAASVMAQEIYRDKSPSGSTVYSDQRVRPNTRPVDLADKVTVIHTGQSAQLPPGLRETSSRYPVVLYTDDSCAPCDSARQHLLARGVPFTERTVSTAESTQAYHALGFKALPGATIGQQVLRGFDQQEWSRYLNAAGYPQTSQLPANYNRPAPSPLAAASTAPDAVAAPTPAAETAAPELPQDQGNNPAGIRF